MSLFVSARDRLERSLRALCMPDGDDAGRERALFAQGARSCAREIAQISARLPKRTFQSAKHLDFKLYILCASVCVSSSHFAV